MCESEGALPEGPEEAISKAAAYKRHGVCDAVRPQRFRPDAAIDRIDVIQGCHGCPADERCNLRSGGPHNQVQIGAGSSSCDA